MSRWGYYSPPILAALAVLAINEPIRQSASPGIPGGPWTLVGLIALAAAIGAQILMLGSQGVGAHVLPVPGGRSIRGGGAQGIGYCMIGAVVAGIATGLLGGEGMTSGTVVAAVIGGLFALVAIVLYAWSWPTAVRDFAEE